MSRAEMPMKMVGHWDLVHAQGLLGIKLGRALLTSLAVSIQAVQFTKVRTLITAVGITSGRMLWTRLAAPIQAGQSPQMRTLI